MRAELHHEWYGNVECCSALQVWSADVCSRHAAAVKCLEFNEMPDGSIKLASSGADHALRIFNIQI
jgi:hypothetical protein